MSVKEVVGWLLLSKGLDWVIEWVIGFKTGIKLTGILARLDELRLSWVIYLGIGLSEGVDWWLIKLGLRRGKWVKWVFGFPNVKGIFLGGSKIF